MPSKVASAQPPQHNIASGCRMLVIPVRIANNLKVGLLSYIDIVAKFLSDVFLDFLTKSRTEMRHQNGEGERRAF
jgi:hypothetical protein